MTTYSELIASADAHFVLSHPDVPKGHFLVRARHGKHAASYLMAGSRQLGAHVIGRIESNEQQRVYLGAGLSGSRRGIYLYLAHHIYGSRSRLLQRMIDLAGDPAAITRSRHQ